jgi:hypothetical protein
MFLEEKQTEKICLAPSLMSGLQIAKLPYPLQLNYAQQLSEMLAVHTDTMLQFEPEVLVQEYMATGLSAILVHGEAVISYGKLYPWPGVSTEGKTVFELGSWLTKKGFEKQGYGSQVARELVKLGGKISPNAQIIAVTELHNAKPQEILTELGGVQTATFPSTFKVLLADGKAELVCFDMTNI